MMREQENKEKRYGVIEKRDNGGKGREIKQRKEKGSIVVVRIVKMMCWW